MVLVLPGEKLVYLALWGVLVGQHAQLRKKKSITRFICEHQKNPCLQRLVQIHGVENVSSVAQVLLKDGIFASTVKAKARFPDAFQATGRPIAPQAKELIAQPVKKSVPEQPRETTAGQSKEPVTAQINELVVETSKPAFRSVAEPSASNTVNKGFSKINSKEGDAVRSAGEDNSQSATIQTTPEGPELDPKPPIPEHPPDYVSLPFWYQHRIMVHTQNILEKACFTFAKKKLGRVLQREKWDCAEAVELNWWTKVFYEYRDEFAQSDVKIAPKPLADLLASISQLRHAAVHRLRLPARSALELITDAEALAKLLQNDGCLEQISSTRRQLGDSIEGLERNKLLLEARLADIKQQFAVKRDELKREEAALREAAEKESRERDFFQRVCSDDTLDALSEAQARWKDMNSVSQSAECLDDAHGLADPGSEPEQKSEAKASAATKGFPEADESLCSPPPSGFKFDKVSSGLRGPSSDSSFHDGSMTTTTIKKTGHHHAEDFKAVVATNTMETLPRLNTNLSCSCPSDCDSEDYATPLHSTSPVDETTSVTSNVECFDAESAHSTTPTSPL